MGLYHLSMLALAGLAAAELPPIHIKGSKFFYENGTQFYMKGIAYQQDSAAGGGTTNKNHYIDPLSDKELCKRDVPVLEELGVNTIRTYAVNPNKDHSACMKMLDQAGIYVISDLSQPSLSIDREQPKWDVELYKRYTAVVDELAPYKNVIGFFAGNEVSDANNNTAASAFVKAAIRDTKKHIKGKGYRPIGVGYATNDHPDIRKEIAQYFNCGKDDEATDFWGYNIYSWCGDSNMEESGYSDQVKFYKDYDVPVFFAEYGCNNKGAANRKFTETAALFSDEMTGVFSGGLVYMYFQEANDYGVVKVKNGKVDKMDDFYALKKQHQKADPKAIDEDDYDKTGERDTCPKLTDTWEANSVLPPTPDEDLCKCAVAASECAVSDKAKDKDLGKIFGYICGEKPSLCVGTDADPTKGIYGAYSMCDARSKLTILLGEYYKDQNSDDKACDFDGKASTKKSSTQGSCKGSMAAASSVNAKAATATAAIENANGDSDDDDDSFGIIGAPVTRVFSIGLYMVVAMAVGGAMIVV